MNSKERTVENKKQGGEAGATLLGRPSQRRRLGLTLAFLAVFMLRISDVVRSPQFWAEDGSIFFRQNMCDGAAAIGRVNGYFHLVPRLVALVVGTFRPTYLPTCYNAAALLLTGVVIYLVQSPRLALPLTLLAIVLCPTGQETYGCLTNVQWFLSLGVLALVLMRPPQSKTMMLLQAALVATAGLTGPFVLLLLPIFGVRLLLDWKSQAARDQMLLLTAAAAITSSVQVYALLNNPVKRTLATTVTGDIPLYIGAAISTHTLGSLLRMIDPWLIVGWGSVLDKVGLLGLLEIGIFLFVALSSLGAPRFRFERLALLYFGVVVLLATFYKFRDYLPGLAPGSDRYFLIPTIVAAWLLISAVREPKVGLLAKISLALLLVSTLTGFRRDPLTNFDWPSWASRLEAGDRPVIPINPRGWFVVTDCKLPQPQVQ